MSRPDRPAAPPPRSWTPMICLLLATGLPLTVRVAVRFLWAAGAVGAAVPGLDTVRPPREHETGSTGGRTVTVRGDIQAGARHAARQPPERPKIHRYRAHTHTQLHNTQLHTERAFLECYCNYARAIIRSATEVICLEQTPVQAVTANNRTRCRDSEAADANDADDQLPCVLEPGRAV